MGRVRLPRALWSAAALLFTISATPSPPSTDAPVTANPPVTAAPHTNPFADKRYYYRASDNDPTRHPVPVEYQTGSERAHIWCYDWYRLPREGGNDWSYFITTCECFSSETLKHFPWRSEGGHRRVEYALLEPPSANVQQLVR